MRKLFFKLIFWILILLLLVLSVIIGLGYIKYKEAINNISLHDKIEEIRNQENYTKLENISDTYKKAVIATEDHRFYDHKGIDYLSLFHSTYINIRSKSLDYGASTITQQVRKTFIFFSRKIFFKKNCRNFLS